MRLFLIPKKVTFKFLQAVAMLVVSLMPPAAYVGAIKFKNHKAEAALRSALQGTFRVQGGAFNAEYSLANFEEGEVTEHSTIVIRKGLFGSQTSTRRIPGGALTGASGREQWSLNVSFLLGKPELVVGPQRFEISESDGQFLLRPESGGPRIFMSSGEGVR